jgi:hypothetical protein
VRAIAKLVTLTNAVSAPTTGLVTDCFITMTSATPGRRPVRGSGQVSPVHPVPVSMTVFATNHGDEPDQTKHTPHERIHDARHNDWHRYHVHAKEERVEHDPIVVLTDRRGGSFSARPRRLLALLPGRADREQVLLPADVNAPIGERQR